MTTNLPNAENLASSFARTDAAITATPLGDHTYTELPRSKTWPAMRITRVGGAPDDADLTFDRPLLQFEVWGGAKSQAADIAETVRSRLATRLPFRTGDGCLKAATRFGGLRYLPDTDEDPARPRYVFDVEFLTSR